MSIKNSIFSFKNGVRVINCTPHSIRFQDGDELIEVPSSGLVINAKPVEEKVSEILVTTRFVGDEDGRKIIKAIREVDPEVLIVGSIIAAQAYPGDVVAMTPVPGFERVPPSEKRMRTDKFTVYRLHA
ncbi:MAG: hypothetical protein H0Z24_08695 [Thermosipho sp. (in: Bacteria)]|nr:hypothetical protein [Thermosipho sp. (in: thermotogales)]